jgi:predicted Zn finger-like uncharacterized protein
MDVTCERCGTEYEFDETLLSGRGTSGKCTNCGQVFKVYPTAEADADRTTSVWRLKLEDDSIDMIDSLRELQRRIASGELTPENQIARGDENWKPLGSIPELETFFEAAGVALPPAGSSSSVPPGSEPPLSEPPTETSKESSLPPGRRPRQPTLLGVMPVEKMIPVGAPLSGIESAAGATAGAESAAESAAETAAGTGAGAESAEKTAAEADSVAEVGGYVSPYSSGQGADPAADTARAAVVSDAPPADEIEEAEFEERPLSGARPSSPPPPFYDDDDDIPGLPGRGGSPLRWLILIVLVGGLALLFAQWPRVARLLGIAGDPALIAASVSDGDASVFEGHPAAYASGIEAYGRAIESGGDRDTEILSKLSNAYALAAQAQIDDGATSYSTDKLTSAALTTARSARELEPRDLQAMLAEADALRLNGDVPKARDVLEDVRSMSFSRTPEFFRIDARLSAAESGEGLEEGLRSAKLAVELAPDGVPYLLLLARTQKAAGNDSEAMEALETIVEAHPGHPVATKLLAELRGAPLEAEALTDAGVEVDAGAEGDAGAETATGAETAAETAAGAVTGAAAGAAAGAETGAETATGAAAVPVTGSGNVSGTETGTGKVAEAEADKVAAKATVAPKAAPARKPSAPKKPKYDEYDRLAEAAGSDSFVDGRPPVRDYESYMRLGRAELAAQKYPRARAYFDSALEAKPGSADAMDGLGRVLTGMKDYISAARYFRVAAQRGHPDGYFNLGRTYERLERNEEAVSAYYTYVKRRPSGTHAGAAIAAIKRLEPRAKLPEELEPPPEPVAKPEPSTADEPAQESEPTTP